MNTLNTPAEPSSSEIMSVNEPLTSLTELILGCRNPENPWGFQILGLDVDPCQFEKDLYGTKAGSLLLKSGESFGISDDTSGYYGDIDIRAGEKPPERVNVRAAKSDFRDGSYRVTLGTTLVYNKAGEYATQKIELGLRSDEPHPSVRRVLTASAYYEQGYEGHGEVELPDAAPEDCEEVLDLLQPFVLEVVGKIIILEPTNN